jgi:DmpG-like communication domain
MSARSELASHGCDLFALMVAVGGQEDMIVDGALELTRQREAVR